MNRIVVDNVSKTFRIGVGGEYSVLRRVLSSVSGREPKTELPVLNGVSFSVEKGEVVGLIGRNGSGKSTLLRIITRIIRPENGRVETNGRLVPLIHLDTSVKPRLTVRENIYLAATFLGLGTATIRRRFDAIIAYAGLEAFADTKWYQLSDGMKQRAVFSVGIHADPEILLLDEVFSVGDEAYRQKSIATIRELAAAGTTILLVGHNLASIERCTDRVIWIEKGRVVREGAPAEIIQAYCDAG